MQKSLAPDISTWPDDEPQLIGSRCGDCGATTFPTQSAAPAAAAATCRSCCCPGEDAGGVDDPGVPARATVRGRETAENFEPFGMGLVQLDDVIRVEGRLTEGDPEKLRFGMEVELTMRPFYTDDDGNEVLMFAFRPV